MKVARTAQKYRERFFSCVTRALQRLEKRSEKYIFALLSWQPSVTRFRSKIIVIHFTLSRPVRAFVPFRSLCPSQRILNSEKKDKARKRKYHGTRKRKNPSGVRWFGTKLQQPRHERIILFPSLFCSPKSVRENKKKLEERISWK